MLFVSKIGKQLFGGKFCFPPKFFCFEIWTEHVEDGFREGFIFDRKGKRNFNLTFIFESSTYPSYTFHPHFFANLKKWGRKQFFSRFLNLAFSLLQSLRMVPLGPSESSTTLQTLSNSVQTEKNVRNFERITPYRCFKFKKWSVMVISSCLTPLYSSLFESSFSLDTMIFASEKIQTK